MEVQSTKNISCNVILPTQLTKFHRFSYESKLSLRKYLLKVNAHQNGRYCRAYEKQKKSHKYAVGGSSCWFSSTFLKLFTKRDNSKIP